MKQINFYLYFQKLPLALHSIVETIINLQVKPDLSKKQLIEKVVQSSLNNPQSLETIEPIFDSCLSTAISTNNEGVEHICLFTFCCWGRQYKTILRDYLSISKVTSIINDHGSMKPAIVLLWLKEVLKILYFEDGHQFDEFSPVSSFYFKLQIMSNLRCFGFKIVFVS